MGLCVCVSVCVSVKSHLTSGASVRPEIDATCFAGNEGQKICRIFSENAPLQRYGVICVSRQRVRLCLLFMTTRASLLGEKAYDISSTTTQ